MELAKKVQQLEQDKYDLIEKYLEKELVGIRFPDEESLANYLKSLRLNSIKGTVDYILEREQEVKEECTSLDFNFTVSINPNWGYVDIYYLRDRANSIYITEVNIEED